MSTGPDPTNLRELLWRYLFHPSTLALIVANLIPLYGVLAWGWDPFLLLMLYWMDTVIIGLWTIATIAILPPGAFGPIFVNGKPTYGRFPRVAFFLVHAGMFAGIHFLFLWIIFAGAWARKVHGVATFVGQIVLASGLWVPLAALFVSRGVSFLFLELYPDLLPKLARLVSERPVRPQPPGRDPAGLLLGFYGRIFLMQIVIIFGAMLAFALGTMAPFILLIVIKTAADVAAHIAFDMGIGRAAASTSTAPALGRR